MTESGRWTRLYLARWPSGAVSVLSAESMDQVVDHLDQVTDASECEVVPFDGDLWLTMGPADDPSVSPLSLLHRPTLEIDSQEAIIEKAFPVLHKVIEASRHETADGDHEDEPIDSEGWRAAKGMERDRILSPSPEWKAAITAWWQGLDPTNQSDDD